MKNLARWIFTSVASHFKTVADDNGIPYFVEGLYERGPDLAQVSHAELRVTGPYIEETSKRYNQIEVVINVLLTSLMDITGDAYELIQWSGVFQNVLLDPIPVYKYGDGAEDTGELLGCLRAKNKKDVDLIHFGQISQVDRVRQSEIDGLYIFWLTDDEIESA